LQRDADLLGIPLQIIIGPKNLDSGKVELKIRKSSTTKISLATQSPF